MLRQVSDGAAQITYDFYLSLQAAPSDLWEWQKSAFGRLSTNGKEISRDIVEGDMAEAQRLGTHIEEIADKNIAHLDKKRSEAVVHFDDLRASIKHFDELASKYILFLTGVEQAHGTLKATFVVDWTRIFGASFLRGAPLLDDDADNVNDSPPAE